MNLCAVFLSYVCCIMEEKGLRHCEGRVAIGQRAHLCDESSKKTEFVKFDLKASLFAVLKNRISLIYQLNKALRLDSAIALPWIPHINNLWFNKFNGIKWWQK